jgi:hypothetical protein
MRFGLRIAAILIVFLLNFLGLMGYNMQVALGAEQAAMQIKPNKTILRGKVERVERASDGWGAHVDVAVNKSVAAEGYADFLQVKPGSVLTLFAADPQAVEVGKTYTLTTSVLGGPRGERVVIEDVQPEKQ